MRDEANESTGPVEMVPHPSHSKSFGDHLRSWYGILGILVATALAGWSAKVATSGYATTTEVTSQGVGLRMDMASRFAEVERRTNETTVRLNEHEARLIRTESAQSSMRETIERIDRRLEKIADKLGVP